MSYKSLYRKYRPKSFSEIVGQEHIVTTLTNAINQKKIAHGYLFAGPRGTGKTTIAHIFANAINNVDYTKENIWDFIEKDNDQFNTTDVIEMDAASNNGVDDVRKIIQSSNYAPINNPYKIYIIDEVHMLSKEAFNALLKTLEEPSKNVIFLFATTEPHKIPLTILSRIQKLKFHLISPQNINNHLKKILNKESIFYEEMALQLITIMANGSLRDALSMVDQIAAFGNNKIFTKNVYQVFGIVSNSVKIQLLNNLVGESIKDLMLLLKNIMSEVIDPLKFTEQLIQLLKEYIIYNHTQTSSLLTTVSIDELNELKLDLTTAYLINDSLIIILKNLRYAESPIQLLEYGFLKIFNDNHKKNIIDVSSFSKESQHFKNKVKHETYDKIEKTTLIKQQLKNNEIKTTVDLKHQDLKIEEKKIEVPQEKNHLDNLKKDENHEIKKLKIKLPQNDLSIEFYLSLLVDFDKKDTLMARERLKNNIIVHLDNKQNGIYANLIKNFKIVASGKNFLIIQSDNKEFIKEIWKICDDNDFLLFIKELFIEPKFIFTISNDELNEIQIMWKKLSSEKNLPKPFKMDAPKLIFKDDEQKKYMNKLFGDKFQD